MSAPKLTEAQRDALVRVLLGRHVSERTVRPLVRRGWVRISSAEPVRKECIALGWVETAKTLEDQQFLTDTGRAALKDGAS